MRLGLTVVLTLVGCAGDSGPKPEDIPNDAGGETSATRRLISVSVSPSEGAWCAPWTCELTPSLDEAHFWWEIEGLRRYPRQSVLEAGAVMPGDTVRCVAVLGEQTLSSQPASAANAPPSLGAVALTPAAALPGDVLTCEAAGFEDDCDAPPSWSTAWTADGTKLTDDGPTLDTALLPPGAAVSCALTPTDGFIDGVTLTSNVVLLTDLPPTPPVVGLSAPNGADGAVTCTLLEPSVDVTDVSYTWWWVIGAGAELEAGPELSAAEVAHCDPVSCRVVATDGTHMVSSESASTILPLGPDCDDGDGCTIEGCGVAGGCSSAPVTCEDVVCGADSCADPSGCYPPPEGPTEFALEIGAKALPQLFEPVDWGEEMEIIQGPQGGIHLLIMLRILSEQTEPNPMIAMVSAEVRVPCCDAPAVAFYPPSKSAFFTGPGYEGTFVSQGHWVIFEQDEAAVYENQSCCVVATATLLDESGAEPTSIATSTTTHVFHCIDETQ